MELITCYRIKNRAVPIQAWFEFCSFSLRVYCRICSYHHAMHELDPRRYGREKKDDVNTTLSIAHSFNHLILTLVTVVNLILCQIYTFSFILGQYRQEEIQVSQKSVFVIVLGTYWGLRSRATLVQQVPDVVFRTLAVFESSTSSYFILIKCRRTLMSFKNINTIQSQQR